MSYKSHNHRTSTTYNYFFINYELLQIIKLCKYNTILLESHTMATCHLHECAMGGLY